MSEANVTDILARLEATWCDVAAHAIADTMRRNPEDVVYAAAFHLFYADGTNILAPALAANTEAECAARAHRGSDVAPGASLRWSPPEWRWDVMDAVIEPLQDVYRQLSVVLRQLPDEAATLYDAHDRVMCSVARRLTAQARTRRGPFASVDVAPYFVALVLEIQRPPEEYEALVLASVEPEILGRLSGILDVDNV